MYKILSTYRIELNRIEEWCTYAKSAILHLNSKLQHPSKNGMYACACVRVCESVYIVGGGFFSFNFKFNCQNTRQLRDTIRAFSPPKITTKHFSSTFITISLIIIIILVVVVVVVIVPVNIFNSFLFL